MHDLRFAARVLSKSPLFAAVAILTLGLGVGANSAIFSLVNTVLLRPFPFPEPDQLVFVWEDTNMFGLKDSVVAMGNYMDWRARNHVFQQMGALEQRRYLVTGAGEALQIQGSIVTASLFRTLGVKPAIGRLFREEEDQPGTAKVAVLSDGFWRRLFGGDPSVLGKTLVLNEEKYEIVGVMPPGFRFPDSSNELWTPVGTAYRPSDFTRRDMHDSMVVARLYPFSGPMKTSARSHSACNGNTRRRTAGWAPSLRRCANISSAKSVRRSWSCWRRLDSCCSSPALILPTFCWRGPPSGGARSQSGRPWAPAVWRLCANFSPRTCCLRSAGVRWAC